MPTDAPPKSTPVVSRRRDVILALLRNSTKPRSIADIAQEMGLHPNTIRFHLDALVGARLVEQLIGDTVGPGRPPVLFRALRRMDPAGPTNYRLLADIFIDYFASSADDPSGAAAELGRSWGTSLVEDHRSRAQSKSQTVADLIELLGDLGFKPEPPPNRRAAQIRLRHCPFHEMVGEHGTMICAVHLGLMQGALDRMRGPVTVDRLEPLVEPDLCVAHLAPASAGNAGSPAQPGGRKSSSQSGADRQIARK
ncbi:helix-turn-helix transcriptional regulator [Mycolicibacterium austroafricanum]|uniref:helix-turn-helix transcriptional regulator n=1 Tax=Mycolicibacterium austroafricanum TaxID=39687 RepID=UPI001CA31A73|nr:helix-turn-helix domain-containing protein [Mycolicibacterium austroafricanum]QZT60447.1 ArsR family transcriptional regulator [Mycolicibacterium austroafricanum]